MTLISQPGVHLIQQAISQSSSNSQQFSLQQLQQQIQQQQHLQQLQQQPQPVSSLAAQQPVLVGILLIVSVVTNKCIDLYCYCLWLLLAVHKIKMCAAFKNTAKLTGMKSNYINLCLATMVKVHLQVAQAM